MSTYRLRGPREQSGYCLFNQVLCLALAAMLLLAGKQGVSAQTTTASVTPAAAEDLVQFPSPEVAFIVGPQLRAGSPSNPYPWFDSTQLSQGLTHGHAFPARPPRTLSGTLAVAQGSRTVTGTATRFTRELDPNGPAPLFDGRLRLRDPAGTYHQVQVQSVASETQLTLTTAWSGPSLTAAPADTLYQHPTQGWNSDHFLSSGYYDLALVEYTNYYRTGDARYLELARKVADSWWSSLYIGEGTVTGGPNNLPPRSMAYAGLLLRAMDGRPELWDYLERQVRFAYDHWVWQRRNYSSLYGDPRETGYLQLYAVMLARVLPDSYPLYGQGTSQGATGTATDGAAKRATYLAQAEEVAVNYIGRVQRADGSWRGDIGSPYNLVATEQPFMVGLLLESVVLLHQLTGRAAVRESLQQQLTQACRHLYRDGFRSGEVVGDMPQYRWRSMWYFWGGGTTADPTLYEREPEGERLTRGDAGMIRASRHLNSTVHHAFGYAYAITGAAEFRQMGEDVFGASYGDSVDQLRGIADSHKAKDYAMNYRASGRYLVWRLSQSSASDQRSASSGGAQTTNALQPPNPTAAPAQIAARAGATPPELIASALALSLSLSQSASLTEAQVREVLERIEAARRAFVAESGRYIAPEDVLTELQAASQHARTALQAAQAGPASYETAKIRLSWSSARLKRATDRVRPR